jgi:starvation-inducible outer membrane lipoprotein
LRHAAAKPVQPSPHLGPLKTHRTRPYNPAMISFGGTSNPLSPASSMERCLRACAGGVLLIAIPACSEPLFPTKALTGLNPKTQMSIFSPEADVYFKGDVTQVGGRVLSVSQTNEGIVITAQELPIKDLTSPPNDSVKPMGVFVFLYQDTIDPQGIQRGNKFVMVGDVEGTQIVSVETIRRPVPYLIARCLHVWKTSTYAISDFPNLPAGYSALEQETYCLPQWR